jgi:hypothetical protein
MQSEGYCSDRLGRALKDARLASDKTESVELQCEVALVLATYLYATGRNRDYLALADRQLEKLADFLPPALLSGLWLTKGIAHYNRGKDDSRSRPLVRLEI